MTGARLGSKGINRHQSMMHSNTWVSNGCTSSWPRDTRTYETCDCKRALRASGTACAHQQVCVEAVLEGPVAHSASVIAEVHNAGVIDAPDMQRLQHAIAFSTAACCKTTGCVAGYSLKKASRLPKGFAWVSCWPLEDIY